MKPVISRLEINKGKDSVCVICPSCDTQVAYVTTSPNDDHELVEKLFKNSNKYYTKCHFCGVEFDWDFAL